VVDCGQEIITNSFRHTLNGLPERATKGKLAGHASVAIRLGMSCAGVGYAVQRGEAIAQENGYQLIQ